MRLQDVSFWPHQAGYYSKCLVIVDDVMDFGLPLVLKIVIVVI